MTNNPVYNKLLNSPTISMVKSLDWKNQFNNLIGNRSIDLSIILPCYNQADEVIKIYHTIKEHLENTINTYEIIVIDDCSPDNSYEKLKEVELNITLLKLEKNSGGAGLPRNFGLSKSRGEYITFIDPGDVIDFKEIFNIISQMKLANAQIAVCNYFDLLPEQKIVPTHQQIFRTKLEPSQICSLQTNPELMSNPFCWAKIFHYQFLENNLIFFGNQYYGEDKVFTWRAFESAEKILIVKDVFLYGHVYFSDQTKNRMMQFDISRARSVLDYDEIFQLTSKNDRFYEIYNKRFWNHEIPAVIFNNQSIAAMFANEEYFEIFNEVRNHYLKYKKTNRTDAISSTFSELYKHLNENNSLQFLLSSLIKK